jgi:predicted ATPase
MKIRQITLENFKGFSQLSIADIPVGARIVMLVGPNGSGKSSLIDAVYMWHRHHLAGISVWDRSYHLKQAPNVEGNSADTVQVVFHDPQPEGDDARRKAVYVRTAYRNEPEFQLDQLANVQSALTENRLKRLIDNDQTVGLNYRRLVSRGFQEAFETGAEGVTLGQFRESHIGGIRDAMQRLFPGLILNSLGNPLVGGTFRFDKGESKAFPYKNLSGGEKAAFDLLLDIYVKKSEFDDTVFFIDEPEAHISTALQSVLFDEIERAIPVGGQLWLSSHSIGFMRRAYQLWRDDPASVVFIDFDAVSFDRPMTLRPAAPDKPFWKRAMRIALHDLADYVAPNRVVLCEGGGGVGSGRDFDADCYGIIFGGEFADTIFLGSGGADDVENNAGRSQRVINAMAPGTEIVRLVDRDDRTDLEVRDTRARGVRVLSMRNIESYLLADATLTQVCARLGNDGAAAALLAAKTAALAASVAAGGPADDLKRVAGDVYLATKRLFSNERLGRDKRSFMRELCAPCVTAGSPLYAQLRTDIFGGE